MMIRTSLLLLILFLVGAGCSNTRFLTEDQVLYTGREKVDIIYDQHKSRSAEVKNYVQSVTFHKVNNGLFGHRMLPPVGLWVQNYWKVNEKKKFGSWVYKTLSSKPILVTDVNPDLRAKNIESKLFDQGYFHSRAWSVVDTSSRNPNKAGVKYFVELASPFHYNKITFDTLHEAIDTLISQNDYSNYIKPGDQFNLDHLVSVRNELSRSVQNKGYFYFIPEYIDLRADTTHEANIIDLVIGRKKELPETVLSSYGIQDIFIHISRSSDTVSNQPDTIRYGDMTIISKGDFLKPDLIKRSVLFTKGETYTYDAYQKTISRLNNLGVFSYARISYEQSGTDSLLHVLDVRIDLILSDNISLDFEADMVTKSSGYVGPQVSAGITNSNTFKGAERLRVAINGGFEWQWGKKSGSELGTLSYDFGIGSGLAFPKIILPGKLERSRQLMIQETSVNLDLDFLNRTAYYRMYSIKAEMNYKWGKSRTIQHSYSPLYINSVNMLQTTPAFDSVVDHNIYIRKSFEEQFIIGMKYLFNFDNTLRIKPHNFFYQAGISTSGNLLDVFAGIGKEGTNRPYYFLGNIYSQHLKLTSDFRYYLHGVNKTFVLRFYAGLGIPYGNSEVLPYVEQFFSGGAYSIRGFTARHLGPGSYNEGNVGYIDQSGDIKLEGNMEYRFGITGIIKGALFLETGNIWLANEDENRPGAKFNFNTFYNQLAVGGGFGLRFDFTFFVLRTDFGLPIRTPYVVDDRNWLFGTGNIFSGALFYLAIGYPF